MNILTAEKARQLRDAITKNAAVIEPTIRDLYIVQALEKALLVLEAKPVACVDTGTVSGASIYDNGVHLADDTPLYSLEKTE